MKTDTELLDWAIFYSAAVFHSKDGDVCWVIWYDSDGDKHETDPIYTDARRALMAAMREQI